MLRKEMKSILLLASIVFLTACTKTKIPEPATTNQPESRIPALIRTSQPSSSPDPFYDMTIPYLRQRTYSSKLDVLQKYQEAPNYTSYVTSYTSDGLRINALITQPKGEKPAGGWPAIVFVHGYIPPKQYRTTEKYIDYVNTLARNGYVVFKIDLRGHGNSDGDPGGGYYSSDYVIDTLNAYAALEASDFVDQKRIGLWGHSMAGNVTMRAFAAKPELPAIVIWAGAGYTYQDLRDYRISDNSYQPQPSNAPSQQRRQELFNAHGQYDPNNEFWKRVAPTNYLNDLKGALQLNHAVDDAVVSINYSRNLNTILNGSPIIHELKEYPSGGHNISGPSFTQAMQNTVNFYNSHL